VAKTPTTTTAERWVDYIDLDEILLAPRNPKLHDTDGIARSVTHFGLAELPLRDERTGRLVAGHGRINDLRTRRAAGATPPAGVRADAGRWLVPVLRGWASETDPDAEAYLLYSNKAVENGGWDESALQQMLADAAAVDFELTLLAGFDPSAIESLISEAAPLIIHEEVPATDADYAETPQRQAERQAAVDAYTPKAAQGLVEMILVYSLTDRDEVTRLVAAARSVLGADLNTPDVVMRGLRTLLAVLDARHDSTPPGWGSLAKHAGWDGAT
jgi:hypothetical protein